MTHAELLAAIDDLRNELAEARRYARTKPDETRDLVRRCVHEIHRLKKDGHHLIADRAYRLMTNLEWGLDGISACPAAIEGYVDGTLWELAWCRGMIEKEVTA